MPLLATQPAVRAGVDVQQHAGHRSPLALAAMRPAFPRPDHQPRSLQQALDTGVAIGYAVLLAELFVKVAHAEICKSLVAVLKTPWPLISLGAPVEQLSSKSGAFIATALAGSTKSLLPRDGQTFMLISRANPDAICPQINIATSAIPCDQIAMNSRL